MDRAKSLLCIADGAENGSPYCIGYYAYLKAYWGNQLAPHRFQPDGE
jgi:hypothetical protein